MATGNMNMNEIREASTNQDSYHISASCRILQDLADVYINPEESMSVNLESPRLKIDSKSETPDKYPNPPHTSPIDLQNGRDSFAFNEKLLECLSKLPMILLSSEERIKGGSPEMSGFRTENPIRSYLEASTSIDSEVKSDIFKGFQDHYENIDGTCSKKITATRASSDLSGDGNDESAGQFSTIVDNQIEKLSLLRVDSENEFNTVFYNRNTLSDKESMIVNWGSDVSDISLEDEYESSDDNSSCTSRDRIEFEALAIDSTVNPTIFQRFQQWKIRGKNKRALSLDDIIPSKILNTTDFSKTKFELNIRKSNCLICLE